MSVRWVYLHMIEEVRGRHKRPRPTYCASVSTARSDTDGPSHAVRVIDVRGQGRIVGLAREILLPLAPGNDRVGGRMMAIADADGRARFGSVLPQARFCAKSGRGQVTRARVNGQGSRPRGFVTGATGLARCGDSWRISSTGGHRHETTTGPRPPGLPHGLRARLPVESRPAFLSTVRPGGSTRRPLTPDGPAREGGPGQLLDL